VRLKQMILALCCSGAPNNKARSPLPRAALACQLSLRTLRQLERARAVPLYHVCFHSVPERTYLDEPIKSS
jgi:hypothetical protein